ncbi:MAG: 2OG-Fe(II) oxygenase family protein [Pseudomonadota bacterium]
MNELAIIDIAPLFNGDEAGQAATDEAIGAAIENHGGFVKSGYPGSDEIDTRSKKLLSFFDLPMEDKTSVLSRAFNPSGPRVYRGYHAHLDAESWAHNEFFDIGPSAPNPAPGVPGMEIFAESNVWPAVEPVPDWRRMMEQHHGQLSGIGSAVMFSAGRAAGFAQADLERQFSGGNPTLRLLNYPRKPESKTVRNAMPDDLHGDDDTLPLSAGRHTDVAGVSLLWQAQAGLQAQAPDGTWRDVPLIRNCISVHLGEVLEVMTEGRIRATPHRVIDHGTARQSIGFFLEPALGTRLAPIKNACDQADPAGPGTYGWHLQTRFSGRTHFKGLVQPPRAARQG